MVHNPDPFYRRDSVAVGRFTSNSPTHPPREFQRHFDDFYFAELFTVMQVGY
jgi:hypothetical protein